MCKNAGPKLNGQKLKGKGQGGDSDESKVGKKEVFHYNLMTRHKLYFIWWHLKEPFFFLFRASVHPSEVFSSEDNAKALDTFLPLSLNEGDLDRKSRRSVTRSGFGFHWC